MLGASWSTFRDRWQVFIGAIVTVCLGVGLVQSALLTLVAAATAEVPRGLPSAQRQELLDGYEGACALLGMSLGLAAFIAIFIVSSTFAFTVEQRRRDLALLRLIGAGRGQVRMLLLGEALLLGAVGSVLGILVGLPLMRGETRMLDDFGFVPPGFTAQWRSWIVYVSLGTGVGVALLGVLAASGRAARVRPLEALRATGRAARVMTVSRWIIGTIFLSGAIAMLILVPLVGTEGALAMSILVSMVLVIAFAAFAPLLAPLVSWPLALVLRGRLGWLARANLRDGVRRSAATATPIMVFVAFLAGLAGAQSTLTEASRRELARTMQGDLVVTTDRPVAAELGAVAGVRAVSEERPVAFPVSLDRGDGEVETEVIDGVAVDPGAFAATHRIDVTEGSLADLRGATIAVSPDVDPERHWHVGDTLRLRVYDEPAAERDGGAGGAPSTLRVVALLPGTLSGPSFLVPAELAPAFAPQEPTDRRYTVRGADGVDESALAARLAGVAGVGEVVTADEWARRYVDDAEREGVKVLVALLGMAMLYTVIAMVNAVVIAASERGHEFATAQVAGLTRSQVVRVALWESLAVVVIGLFLGGLAAAGTVGEIALTTRHMLGTAVVVVQWPLLGSLALGSALIVGVTSVLTTLSATRTPAIRLVGTRD